MSTFEPEFPELPSEDAISAFLAAAGCDLDDPFPATRPRPDWRGGPPIGPDADREFFDSQDDRD